jgi:transcriptional regulator with XRE-family HTH domain
MRIFVKQKGILMIGNRIRKYRLSKEHTVKVMADIIGISQGTLSDIENGKSKPSADTLSSIVRRTDINPFWLLTGGDEMITSGLKQPPDLDFMKEVIETVETILGQESKRLAPDKKANLVALIYETMLKEEAGLTGAKREKFLKNSVIKFIRLVS